MEAHFQSNRPQNQGPVKVMCIAWTPCQRPEGVVSITLGLRSCQKNYDFEVPTWPICTINCSFGGLAEWLNMGQHQPPPSELLNTPGLLSRKPGFLYNILLRYWDGKINHDPTSAKPSHTPRCGVWRHCYEVGGSKYLLRRYLDP